MITEGISYTSSRREGALEMGPSAVTPLATAEDTAGRYSLVEVRDEPGSGPPMHRHLQEDEAFYILEGEYEIYSQDGLVTRAGPGTFVLVHQGTVQGYRCAGPGAGRMLVIGSPGGFERFFAELDELARKGEYEPGKVGAAAARHHIEVVGPPPPGRS
jgi:quercetin dioxygenase-like cupin family protein